MIERGLFSLNMNSLFYLKDVRSKILQSLDLKFLLQSDNELLASKMPKQMGVTEFVSEIKRVENYPDFEKSAWSTVVYS